MKLSQRTLRDGTLCVRTAQRRSAKKIVECLAGCDDYRKKFTSYRTTEEWLDALFDEAERDDCRRLCVVLNQEQVVGILELVQDHPDEITIALLAIASVHRVRGFGRRVVKLIAGAAEDSGTNHLAIGVETAQPQRKQFLGGSRVCDNKCAWKQTGTTREHECTDCRAALTRAAQHPRSG